MRLTFGLLILVVLYACFAQPSPHGSILQILGSGLACAGLAVGGPLAFPALSYSYWLRTLLIVAGLAKLSQALPQAPDAADLVDYAVQAGSMISGVLLFFLLGLGNANDWDDLPIHDRAWKSLD